MGLYQAIFRISYADFLLSRNKIIKNINEICSDMISMRHHSTLLKMVEVYFSSKNWEDIKLFGDKILEIDQDIYVEYDLAFIRYTDLESIKILSKRFRNVYWSDIVDYFEDNYDWSANDLGLDKYITEIDLSNSEQTYHTYEYYERDFEEFKTFYIKAEEFEEIIVSFAIP